MIRTIYKNELEQVANFIYTKNHENDKQSFYMSLSLPSIKDDLYAAIDLRLAYGSFNPVLNGVIVCYKHPHEHVMDCAGPFYDDIKIAEDLIHHILKVHQEYKINFFFKHRHQELFSILSTFTHHLNGYEFQMKLGRNDWMSTEIACILKPLDANTKQSFVELFHQIFPDAYISANDIVLNIDRSRDVYIVLDNGFVIGYIVIKSYPLYPRKKTIEMVGVKESERSKGIGKKIINEALHIIFHDSLIESVDLIVDLDNRKALTLYEQFGFKIDQTAMSITIDN